MSGEEEFIFSVLNEAVKDLGKPHWSKSEIVFFFRKDNVGLKLSFDTEGADVEAFVPRAGLFLDHNKLASFCAELKKVRYIPMTVEINTFFTTRSVYSVFPRIIIGIDKSKKNVMSEIRAILQALNGVAKIIEEYRAYDKSSETIKTLWKQSEAAKTKNEKGKRLEELLAIMISLSEDFRIITQNKKTKSEEIDLVVENLGISTFFSQLRSPLLLVECKNWFSKVGAKEVRDFSQKLQNRNRMLCSVGVLVTPSGITKDANEELLGYRGKDFLIAILDGGDLNKIVRDQMKFGELLKDKISEAGLR
jgi:hypothetical protein